MWRLNNLYFIKNKQGQKVLFNFTLYQKYIYENLWFLNIFLKARQLGITTFFAILFLDCVLFGKDKKAAIIAHRLESAKEIFEDKIHFAWENMNPLIKMIVKADTSNKMALQFDNGSSIAVTTSARSGTINYLHISELGIMAFKYPDKAREVVSGSLNTVAKGQFVSIEATAKGQEGAFYDLCQLAMEHQKNPNHVLTELDYRFFFFPWYECEDYVIDNQHIVINSEMKKYFASLEKTGINLTRSQKNWYVKKRETQLDEMYSEFPSTPEEAFKANVEGSYYGKYFDRMVADGRLGNVPWTTTIKVDTYWDLGVNDETVIIFVQDMGTGALNIIDEYVDNHEGVEHYINILKNKPYIYGRHFAPHDIDVQEWGSGKTRKETAASLGLFFNAVDKMAISEGIQAVRNMLPRVYLDEERCPRLKSALIGYRKEWDDKHGVFRNNPLHNEHSHPADALRTMGVAIMPHIAKKIIDRDPDPWQKPGQLQGSYSEQSNNFDKNGLFPTI